MCIAVNTTWRNTGITDTDIRRVFYRQPCLVCVLAKRNRDRKLIFWSIKPPLQPPLVSTPSPLTTIDTKDSKPPDHCEDHQCSIGECISYDNVGPISPESIEGYTRSKYLFCYPIKTCNEETFLYYLEHVLSFFTTREFKPRLLRSDYYTIFRSHKANLFYEEHQCRHESSAPYQQWKNAVELDIHKSSPMYPQQFTARISSAQIYGPILSPTGTDCTTPPHMRLLRTHPPESLTPIFSSMHITNTDSYSGTYSASLFKTTNDFGCSMLKTISVFMWPTRTVSKAVP